MGILERPGSGSGIGPTAASTSAVKPGTSAALEWLAVLVLAGSGVLLAGVEAPTRAIVPSHWVVIPLVALGFFLAERFAFHVEYKQEAIGFSPCEIPLAYGLVFLAPHALICARVVGSGLAIASGGRQPRHKLLFNVAVFALEVAIAVYLMRNLIGAASVSDPRMWLSLLVAIVAAMVTGGVLVSVAVSLFDGDLIGRLARQAIFGHALYVVSASTAVLAVLPAVVHPALALMSIAPVAAMWAVARAHGRLGQLHRDLSNVHTFGREIGGSFDIERIAATSAEHVRTLLRAERVMLVAFGVDGRTVCVSGGDDDAAESLPHGADDPAWVGLLRAGEPLLVGPANARHDVLRRLMRHGSREAIVAPMAEDSLLLGLMVIVNRIGASDRFSHDDLARVAVVAQQIATSLRKARFQHQSTHDRLTGLPVRSLLESRIEAALCNPGVRSVSVMMIDLDRFKAVNDTYGHHVGDRVLEVFCRRVSKVLRRHDVVGRFAGDEFAVFLPGANQAAALAAAERILAQLARPMDLGELELTITASIGVAIGPEPEDTAATMLRRADVAMYVAKRERNRAILYRPEMGVPPRLPTTRTDVVAGPAPVGPFV